MHGNRHHSATQLLSSFTTLPENTFFYHLKVFLRAGISFRRGTSLVFLAVGRWGQLSMALVVLSDWKTGAHGVQLLILLFDNFSIQYTSGVVGGCGGDPVTGYFYGDTDIICFIY